MKEYWCVSVTMDVLMLSCEYMNTYRAQRYHVWCRCRPQLQR